MYKLPNRLHSKYEFVSLASKRAEQLQMGARPKVESNRRVTIIAQEEVATGLIGIWVPEEEQIVEEEEEE